MKISGRLALAMVLLVVATSCMVSAFACYFVAERCSARGVDVDRQRGAGRRRDCGGARDRACSGHDQRSARAAAGGAKPADAGAETEQARAYQALADRERMAQAIIEEALDAFVQTDGSCVVLNWSPHAEALMGWTREEAVGRSVEKLLFPESLWVVHRQWVDRFLSEATGDAAGGRYETPLLHKDGSEFFAEVSLTALRRNEGYIINAFVRDITAKRAARRTVVPGAEDGIGRAIDRRHRP